MVKKKNEPFSGQLFLRRHDGTLNTTAGTGNAKRGTRGTDGREVASLTRHSFHADSGTPTGPWRTSRSKMARRRLEAGLTGKSAGWRPMSREVFRDVSLRSGKSANFSALQSSLRLSRKGSAVEYLLLRAQGRWVKLLNDLEIGMQYPYLSSLLIALITHETVTWYEWGFYGLFQGIDKFILVIFGKQPCG